nr:RuBisCO long chain, Form III-b [uncultured archaeon]
MKPEDFINLKYRPKEDDLICLFKVEPAKGITIKNAAANVALESSIGTWVEVSTEKQYMKKLAAKVFSIKEDKVKIAYPSELFEKGNAPNILSSIAGNIFGMKIVKNLRLEDIKFPTGLLKSFPGPKFGIQGIRKVMKINSRPLIGTIIKPKLGLKPKDHALSAYNSWVGGLDLVKCDENLASQKFNEFEKRLSITLEMADKAEEKTGERKGYLENVTAETKEMIKRAQLVENMGGKYIMVDILTEGWGAVQTLREANFNLIIHAHRAFHAAFTRNKKHGMSMMVVADLVRIIGLDQIHIGTGIGKLQGDIRDIKEIEEEIENKKVKETKDRLNQDWGKIKPTLAVCSGGLQPAHIPFLINHLGKDIVIQLGGGVHGHKDGSYAGAKASRQALDATIKKISLRDYSKDHLELKTALEQWGYAKTY